MNHEVEAYEGELKELREKNKKLKTALLGINYAHKDYVFLHWTPVKCGCGKDQELLVKYAKVMCRQCWQDHFEESQE